VERPRGKRYEGNAFNARHLRIKAGKRLLGVKAAEAVAQTSNKRGSQVLEEA